MTPRHVGYAVFLLAHAAWWITTAILVAERIGWMWTGALFTSTVLIVYLAVAMMEVGE